MENFLHNNSHENPKRPQIPTLTSCVQVRNPDLDAPSPFPSFASRAGPLVAGSLSMIIFRGGRALAEIHTRRGISVEIGGNGLACATEIVFGSALRSPQRARRATASAITTRSSRIAEMATAIIPPAGPPTSPVFVPEIV